MTIFSYRFHLETCIEKMRKVVGYLVPLVLSVCEWFVHYVLAFIIFTLATVNHVKMMALPVARFLLSPHSPQSSHHSFFDPITLFPAPQIPGNEMPCQAISYDDVLTSRLSRVLWTRFFSLLQRLYIKIFQQATLIAHLHVNTIATSYEHHQNIRKCVLVVYRSGKLLS